MTSKKNKKPTSDAESGSKSLGEAPAIALGNVYQEAAHSTGILFENAVNAQQQQNILGQAATTQGIMQIYSLDTVADAISISKMLDDERVEPEHDAHHHHHKKHKK